MLSAESPPTDGIETENGKLSFDTLRAYFRALLVDSGDGTVLAGANLGIVEASPKACELHGGAPERFSGMDAGLLIAGPERPAFIKRLQGLGGGESWSAELMARRLSGETFPAAVTVKRLDAGHGNFFAIVVRDLSESITTKQMLRQERSHRREMYNTLRSLMKSFEKEKQGLESGIRYKIESLLLPALDKIERESDADVRNAYVDILRRQLVELTKTFAKAIDASLLSLTRTEMRICQFIQNGCTGKEIAEKMNISFETVQVHRRNIRRKLGLTGRNVNLYAFLSTKPLLRSSKE